MLPHKKAHVSLYLFLSLIPFSIYGHIIHLIIYFSLVWKFELSNSPQFALLIEVTVWGSGTMVIYLLTVGPVSKCLNTFDENRHKMAFKKREKNKFAI